MHRVPRLLGLFRVLVIPVFLVMAWIARISTSVHKQLMIVMPTRRVRTLQDPLSARVISVFPARASTVPTLTSVQRWHTVAIAMPHVQTLLVLFSAYVSQASWETEFFALMNMNARSEATLATQMLLVPMYMDHSFALASSVSAGMATYAQMTTNATVEVISAM